MKLGRLGSIEPEHDIGMQFLGWGFGNLNLGQAGGGVQSFDQEMAAQGRSAAQQRAEFIRGEITMDQERPEAGAANVPYDFYVKRVHGSFLEQHPGLKRFLKNKYPQQKESFYSQPLSGFGVLTPPTDAELESAQQEVNRRAAELAAAQTEAYSTTCNINAGGNLVPVPKIHCEPQLGDVIANAIRSLETASTRLGDLHRRREEAASTPEEAAAARQEAQSVSAAQGDLQIAQQDLQNAANQLAQAAATGDPTQIAQAAANLGTASDRTGQAAQGVELATSAARRQKYMKYGAIGGAILLLLGLGYYFVVKG